MNPTKYLLLFASLCVVLCAYPQKKPKKELYVPMDYSTCGYHASEQAIPNVQAVISVAAQEGDCSDIVQQAIDKVATQKADATGMRGAVLLGEGTFYLDQALRIPASGIVLRGMGKDKTILKKRGFDRGAIIYIEGQQDKPLAGDTLRVVGKVTAGSTQLTIKGSTAPLHPGDRIHIVRPCTREWIDHLGMYDFGGGLDYTGWKPTDLDITWDRTVTAVDGSRITIDAPITTTLSEEFGGGYILRAQHSGELRECGVENLTLEAAANDWNPCDEDHCWDGIHINHARDCWVRRVDFRHLAGSAVNLQRHTSRITIEDCISHEPVSERGGWRRCTFTTRGQQTLFQRCVSRQGIHDFSAGFGAAGPNAFVQCEGEESLGFSGSIGSWAAGLLFDIVNIDGNDLRFANLQQFQFGTGWNTANSMFWQCTASAIECFSPDEDNRNSAHGSWGMLTGNGEWTSSNDHVQPRSLFYDQLVKRLTEQGADKAEAQQLSERLGHILPRPTNASTSPTVEEAMRFAQESLMQPRLTLEMWMDSIPYQAPLTVGKKGLTLKPSKKPSTADAPAIALINGHIAAGQQLVTGNNYDIPWWSGRVKDNFVSRDARPAITRFVPGREATGWTDRIDSVVGFLGRHHFSSLDHHYGLWYDLRRTDHERVRRADGDVWAPFYEQPFARCGRGTAWDGLSRYDLTQPNQWYWQRLRDFADKAAPKGILLLNQHYFQHNILEAGAHWVDCPWRPVNNVNGTDFPEPVPFAGDKRIFIAEQFYNEQNEVLRPLHRQYIRMCLDQLKDQPNVVHLISAEYTGPLHFTRFWLETIAEWEAETGRHPLVALSCTKDAQDNILADPRLSRVVDIIDIRYWHYNTEGLWAPQEGRNMAPRQWMRKVKVGKTGFEEVYRAVREYAAKYPDKAVTYFAQQYPENGWAVLLAGGSLPNIPVRAEGASALQQMFLRDVCLMRPMDAGNSMAMGGDGGYLVYARKAGARIAVSGGKYDIHTIDMKSGEIKLQQKAVRLDNGFSANDNKLYWLKFLGR